MMWTVWQQQQQCGAQMPRNAGLRPRRAGKEPAMGEYEPRDSRKVTLKDGHVPGEPPRTGPREQTIREQARDTKDPVDPRQQPLPEGK